MVVLDVDGWKFSLMYTCMLLYQYIFSFGSTANVTPFSIVTDTRSA